VDSSHSTGRWRRYPRRASARYTEGYPQNPLAPAGEFDGGVDAVVEIYNRVIGPELFSDLLAGYDLALTLNEHSQNQE
jgi:hypothetical protein